MAVLKPLSEDTNDDVKELARFFNETLGFTPNSVLTMQRRPAIAKAFIELNKAVMENHGRLTSGQKRLIAYLSSKTYGCGYCEAHTIRAAERYGERDERLNHIHDYQTSDLFTDAERAAFNFTIAASAVPNAVNDEMEEELRRHWDEGEIVEIVGVIALFGYLNRWNASMSTPIEDDAAGSALKFLSDVGWDKGRHA